MEILDVYSVYESQEFHFDMLLQGCRLLVI